MAHIIGNVLTNWDQFTNLSQTCFKLPT